MTYNETARELKELLESDDIDAMKWFVKTTRRYFGIVNKFICETCNHHQDGRSRYERCPECGGKFDTGMILESKEDNPYYTTLPNYNMFQEALEEAIKTMEDLRCIKTEKAFGDILIMNSGKQLQFFLTAYQFDQALLEAKPETGGLYANDKDNS